MKRSFDILVSGFALLMFAAPLIVLMALVRLTSSGPSLYWSARVGKDGKTFQMPKLRTMAVNTPELPTHEFDNPEAYITGFRQISSKKQPR
jgi:O-antigen biosynthesis protein WbqP